MNDEAVRGSVTGRAGPLRRMVEVDRAEALRLLGSVPVGRVVFTQGALPAIRPVNHLVDGESVVIRTHLGGALAGASGLVVAYQADALDNDTHLGWSVVVTGLARLVTDREQLARYERLLHPWVDLPMQQAVRIGADLVTGFRLIA